MSRPLMTASLALVLAMTACSGGTTPTAGLPAGPSTAEPSGVTPSSGLVPSSTTTGTVATLPTFETFELSPLPFDVDLSLIRSIGSDRRRMEEDGLAIVEMQVSAVRGGQRPTLTGTITAVVWGPKVVWGAGAAAEVGTETTIEARASGPYAAMVAALAPPFKVWLPLQSPNKARAVLVLDTARPGHFLSAGGDFDHRRPRASTHGRYGAAATMLHVAGYDPETSGLCSNDPAPTPADALLAYLDRDLDRPLSASTDPVTGENLPETLTVRTWSGIATPVRGLLAVPVGVRGAGVDQALHIAEPASAVRLPDLEDAIFFEIDTGRVLGPLDGNSLGLASQGADWTTFILAPAPGRDVAVFFDAPLDDPAWCPVAPESPPDLLVPYDEIAGSGRIVLDPVEKSYAAWTPDFLGTRTAARAEFERRAATWRDSGLETYEFDLGASSAFVLAATHVVVHAGEVACHAGEAHYPIDPLTIDELYVALSERIDQHDEAYATFDDYGAPRVGFNDYNSIDEEHRFGAENLQPLTPEEAEAACDEA